MTQKRNINATPLMNSTLAMNKQRTEQQLQRILNSSEFHATRNQCDFFRFVVLETLAGRSHEIKGYTVATQVFGRKEDFDPGNDPVVSIHANKLRRALERYYLTAGIHDSIRIDIPKGTYVPTFHQQKDIKLGMSPQKDEQVKSKIKNSWPILLVRPFQNLTGDPGLNYICVGFATELAMEITRYRDIGVLQDNSGQYGRRIRDNATRFAVVGNVRKDATGVKVSVSLIDSTTQEQVWADTSSTDFDSALLISFQEHVGQVVAAKIASESGIIAKTLSAEMKNTLPSDLTTYEAILKYNEFGSAFSAETFFNAFEALKFATANEPGCGLVWAMLARLYAINYSMELFDLETSIEEAVSFAKRGIKLDPTSQRAIVILAYVLIFENELPAGLIEINRGLALNPNSLLCLENIGYVMALLGDWKQGSALIRRAIKFNPYYNIHVHYVLCADWVRQGDYQKAYQETMHFNSPTNFWDHLLRAALFGLLDSIQEGEQAAAKLLKLKPDFLKRGRTLIRHYIKPDEIFDRMIKGLAKAGIDVE